uniref:DUF569 domain-containing protein n=1 Tax=Oryza glumipatula TaxID=40148 RepID=A0A0E0AR92_9ORYZ
MPPPPRRRNVTVANKLLHGYLPLSSSSPRHATPRLAIARALSLRLASPPRARIDRSPHHRGAAMESLSNVLARQPMMEVFQEVEFAALRIWKSGSYLHADEDGRSVYVGSLPRDGGGDSRHCAVWAVEPPIDAAAPLPQYVRLRGAYGRYLGAPDSYGSPLPFLSVDAAQRDRDRVEMDAIMWQPVACSGSDVVGGRDARGVSGFVAACFPPLLRVIEFVGEDDLDNIGEGEIWTTVETRGRSVRLLKEKIAKLVGYDDFTMCVSAGRHGQFTPLLIDLRRSRETLNIVLLRTNSEGKHPSSCMNVAEFSERCLCDSEFCCC